MWAELFIKPFKYDLDLYEKELKDKYSDDKAILYADKEHTYTYVGEDTLLRGKRFDSVTGVIKSFLPKFNGSTAKAEKEMMLSAKDVRRVWDANRDYAGNRGTFIHACLELVLGKGMIELRESANAVTMGELSLLPQLAKDEEVNSYIRNVQSFIKNDVIKRSLLNSKIDVNQFTIHLEKIVYSPKYKIAGQYDCKVELLDDATILDWKTNDKVLTKPYGFFAEPFDRIQNTLINQYSFQLCIYLCLEMNANEDNPMYNVPSRAVIVHLKDGELTPYEVDMDKFMPLAKEMLEYYSMVKA
jgi:hypothetical protein